MQYLMDGNNYSLRHFYANWATLKEVCRYLRWMQQENVYDHSLIILASDHGRDVRLLFDGWEENNNNYGYFMPLLLVKLPGNSTAPLQIDLTARSNADIPAFASLVLPPEKRYNPFTKKALEFHNPNAPRYSHYIGQNPNEQQRDRFALKQSYRITGPIWLQDSWQRLP